MDNFSSFKLFYFDDGHLNFEETYRDRTKKRNLYFISGYSIYYKDLRKFNEKISLIKKRFGLEPEDPIKWNLRDDRIKQFYNKRGKISKYKHLLSKADDIRTELLNLFCDVRYNTALYLSAIVEKKKGEKKVFDQRCFTNLLQRISMHCDPTEFFHFVFLDFYKEDTTDMAESYSLGYHHGRDTENNKYRAGSLSKKGFCEAVYFGKTIYNQLLQMADLVAGCSRDYLEFCLTDGVKVFKDVLRFFPIIMDKFYTFKNTGLPFRAGIVISPDNYYEKLENSFKEIKELSSL